MKLPSPFNVMVLFYRKAANLNFSKNNSNQNLIVDHEGRCSEIFMQTNSNIFAAKRTIRSSETQYSSWKVYFRNMEFSTLKNNIYPLLASAAGLFQNVCHIVSTKGNCRLTITCKRACNKLTLSNCYRRNWKRKQEG